MHVHQKRARVRPRCSAGVFVLGRRGQGQLDEMNRVEINKNELKVVIASPEIENPLLYNGGELGWETR